MPCRGSRCLVWSTPPSATRRWWPSRRRCGGGPRWRPYLSFNPFGDEGLAALVAPPPAGTPPLPAGGLKKLELLVLDGTQITDAGCASLAAALNSGALPALEKLDLTDIPASAEAKAAVYEARADLEGAESDEDADEDADEDEWDADADEDEDEWDEDEGS